MFSAALIVFRESLEAALIIGIMAAATRGIAHRARWIVAGVVAGIAGAATVASSMEYISGLASGIGQELFNAAVLLVAVGMLAWHNVWMSVHGREMAEQAKSAARDFSDGRSEGTVILAVVALAVLREGAETVLFLYALATGGSAGLRDTLVGGALGLGAGALLGFLIYAGLLRIPLRRFFAITSALVLLLAASMASQAAFFLIQADLVPSLGTPIWDTSGVLAQDSPLGMLLHGLVGYAAQPAGMQIVFYLTALLGILAGMKRVQARARQAR